MLRRLPMPQKVKRVLGRSRMPVTQTMCAEVQLVPP